MPFSASTPEYTVPHAQPQWGSSLLTHGTCTPFTVRSPGGRPISRMRTPGSCRWTSRQQCSRNHWIPRWLVGVSPLPMKPMLAVRRKERSCTAIGLFLLRIRNARIGILIRLK